MYSELGIESDGELYKMQQDAIRRARETAAGAKLPRPESEAPIPTQAALPPDVVKREEGKNLFGGFELGKLFKGVNGEELLIVGVILILLLEEAPEELILILLFVLFSGGKGLKL